MTVVSLVRLQVRSGEERALVNAFREHQVFEHSRASGSFLGGRLLRPLGDSPFLVVAEWENEDAYRGWLESSVRSQLGERLEPLLSGDVQAGELYEDG
jgi:heme-degrading monooxygenase HmoA